MQAIQAKRDAKPAGGHALVWALFAGGGMIAALMYPALIVFTGFIFLQSADFGVQTFETIRSFLQNPFFKIVAFFVIVMPFWHGMHRLHLVFHDLQMHRIHGILQVVLYLLAIGFSIAVAVILIQA